ncbi:MAG: hypothetical protein V1806_06525 [Pseudomonadota bacterium]
MIGEQYPGRAKRRPDLIPPLALEIVALPPFRQANALREVVLELAAWDRGAHGRAGGRGLGRGPRRAAFAEVTPADA